MNEFLTFVLLLTTALTAIVGGLIFAGLGMYRRTRIQELAFRERVAMIEKGLMPSPETDPARFERAFRRGGGVHDEAARSRSSRRRSGGIMLMGVGLGLAMVIYFAGNEPGSAIGVGGMITFIGLAMVINSLLDNRDQYVPRSSMSSSSDSTPSARADQSERPSPGL